MIFLFCLVPVALCFAWLRGASHGRQSERARCLSLTSQSWQQEGASLSPTARRIYHSIEKGHVQLVTVDGFFGKPVIDDGVPLREIAEKRRAES